MIFRFFNINLLEKLYVKRSKSLNKFLDEVKVEPKFRCIICGLWDAIVKDSETGIYIISITALRP